MDADGIRSMINGGGDVRFSSDAAGLTRLAVDVREAVTDNTPANATLELAIKIASVSSSVDTVIYMWWGKAAETQPSVSDTYGQYNAYDDDYVLVLPLTEDPSDSAPQFKDRTSGQHHGSDTSGDLNSVAGQVGNAINFDDVAADSYLSVSSFSDIESMTALSVEMLAMRTGSGDAYSELLRKGTANAWFLLKNDTTNYKFSKNGDSSEYQGTGQAATIDTWFHLCATGTSGTTRLYSDGASVQNTSLSGIASNTSAIDIGNYAGGSQQFDGTIDEVRVSKVARSAAWAKANYNNQTDQTGFLTWGSIVDIETGSFAATLPILTMSASGSASSGGGSATGTFAGSLPIFTMAASGDTVRNGPFAGSLPIPTMSASGSAGAGTTGTFASSLPVPTMSASGATARVGTFAGSLPIFTMASSGTKIDTGTFAASLPVPTMASSGSKVETGTFAGSLPVPTMSASGAVGAVSGLFSSSLPIFTMSSSGTRVETGTFSGSLPIPTMLASGGVLVEGAFAASLPIPTMAGVGAITIEGSFASSCPIPTMAGVGVINILSVRDVVGSEFTFQKRDGQFSIADRDAGSSIPKSDSGFTLIERGR